MFLEIASAKYLDDYRIEAVFNNGVIKEIDLANHLTGKVFEPLKEKKLFRQFEIQFNTVSWQNGADFAPEFLFEIGKEIKKKKVA